MLKKLGLESFEAVGFHADVDLEFATSGTGWKASTPSAEDGEPQIECEPVDALALRSLPVRHDSGRWIP